MRNLKVTQKITNRTSSESFTKYLSEINKIKPFDTAEDEYTCAVKAKNGDESALDELITRNLRFVISVAKNYETKGIPLADLVNQGNSGLVIAASKFDPHMGFKFISYAVWYIRREITEFLNKNSRVIRIPVNRINELSKVKQEMNKLEQVYGRDIFDVDLVDIGLSENTVTNLINIDSMRISSLDSPISSDSDSGVLIDIIKDDNLEPTDYLLTNNDHSDVLGVLLSKLTSQQSYVIKESFGVGGEEPKTLGEIGVKLNMSKEGVRQIKNKSLKILKVNSRKLGLKIPEFS